MQAGRSGRQCRERASRRCSPCDCGLHPVMQEVFVGSREASNCISCSHLSIAGG
uniref:Patatin like phospholipase domain containing 8 n=1 Tax=Mandrillus leucophaeus TaxID=9568 RepID=A0A2K6A507_MANLE